MKAHWLLAAAVVLVLGAEAKDDAKGDAKNIQGTWTLTRMERGGTEVDLSKEKGLPSKVVFDATTVTVTVGDKEHKGTYKLDPSQKPRAIDIVPQDGPEKGKTMKALYQLKGNTLTICLEHGAKERPKKLASEKGSHIELVVFKRAES